ncbi:MAG TPA: MraY family glycosyltransferase [Candidatus Saccharimonadales bacterium]|nr:MraY family glycosyltransferase [Candidatus Saccharimonadales bacterium]
MGAGGMAVDGTLFRALAGAALGFFLALYGTPVAARAAIDFNIVDRPDGALKKHRGPVPYLGGLAIYAAFLLALGLVFEFDRRVLGILLAGTIVVLLGLIDDFGVLGVGPKFAGQIVAAWVLVKSDIAIHIALLPAWLSTPLTILWIVGMANAFNIIDVMDGLSAGTALIASLFLLVISVLNGEPAIVVLTAVLTGALLGFLRYNYHPARIFMGDCGSLFIGMTLAALAMIGKYDRYNSVGYLSPLLILAIPIFDTAFVTIVRLSRSRSPFRGSPDHFAIRLRAAGFSVRGAVNLTYLSGAVLGGLALFNLFLSEDQSLFLVGGAVMTMVIVAVGLARVRVGDGTE